MGRRAQGSSGARVRVFSFEEGDEDWTEPGPGPGPGLRPDGGRVPARAQVPDGAAPLVAPDVGPRALAPPARRRPWSARTRLLAAAGALTVVLLGAGGVVQGETNERARLDRVVAAGGVRPLGADVGVAWSVEPHRRPGEDPASVDLPPPAVVDGVLVVPGDQVVGYDPATGEERWRRSLAASASEQAGATTTLCSGTGPWGAQEGPLVCTTSAYRLVSTAEGTFEEMLPVRVDVMVPATGEVTTSSAFAEGTQGVTVFDEAIATVRWGTDGQVVVELTDLATGAPRWSREVAVVDHRADGGYAGYLGVHDGGAVLLVGIEDRTVTLDGAGEVVDEAADSWTVPLADGGAVVQHRDGSSTVLDRDGAPLFRTQGAVLEPGARDGDRARALFVTEGGARMDASGTIDAPRTSALDPTTGRALWTAEGVLDAVVAQVGDVGVLSGGGRLWAVDLGSGRRLWEAAGHLSYSSAHTDGTDLYLVGSDGTGGMRITAISVESGQELWTAALPLDGGGWGFVVQGRLVVVEGDGGVTGVA